MALGAALFETVGFPPLRATNESGAEPTILALPGRGRVTIFPVVFVTKRCDRREVSFLIAAIAEIGQEPRGIAAEWDGPT